MENEQKSTVFNNVSIVIPAYNEQSGIEDTLIELKSFAEFENTQIIVVDDGSTDETYKSASSVEGVYVLRHRKNKGYGSSIKTGASFASGDIIAWYDADMQHRPQDLIRLLNEMVEKDLDYCIAVRDKDSHVQKSRVLGKFILKLIVRLLVGKTGDFNSGMRAFKSSVLNPYLTLLPRRFGASTVTTVLMIENNYYGSEVNISVRPRQGSKSTVRQLRDGFNTINLVLNMVLLFRPMQIFGTFGILSILVGGVYGLVRAIQSGEGIPTLAALLIIFGFQILLFGVLSSQISRVRREEIERYTKKDDNK